MSFIARLRKGIRKLDLNNNRFAVAESFVPPSASYHPLLASGTSANRRGGSAKLGQRANDIRITLPIYVMGESEAEVQEGRRILATFIGSAGQDPDEPVYFEWRGDDSVPFEPVWGQYGIDLRYEITHADPPKSWKYRGVADTRKEKDLVQVPCMFKPYIAGKRQKLATASGGLVQDKFGKLDGISRGLQIPGAATNYFTNPVFMHATYDTGWTVATNLIGEENNDPEYVMFGDTSLKLTAEVSTTTNVTATQSIDVGDTNNYWISFYAKRQDSAELTSSEITVYYGVSYNAWHVADVGDGWYRFEKGVVGIASATDTGLRIVAGNQSLAIYVDGFQIEDYVHDYATPLCYGDMLGCSWAGTVHGSTSTRVVSELKLDPDSIFNVASGTIRMALRIHVRDDWPTSDFYFFYVDGTNDLAAYWDQSADKFALVDGTNTVVSTTTVTWLPGDIIVFHFTFGPDGLQIYWDGAINGTGATYQPVVAPLDIYIGSDATPANHGVYTMMDFTIYDRAMTAAEVLADYNNASKIIDDNIRMSPLPWLWTKDGDNIVDNCNDSTRDNYCVIGGVPGNVPAITRFLMTRSLGTAIETIMSLLDIDEWMDPADFMFFDLSGVADVGNSCGDAYENDTPGGDYAMFDMPGLTNRAYSNLAGREVRVVTRLGFFASSGLCKVVFRYGSLPLAIMESLGRNITGLGATTFRLYYSDGLILPSMSRFFLGEHGIALYSTNQEYQLRIYGGAGAYNCDYFTLLPRPFLIIDPDSSMGIGSVTMILEGKRGIIHKAAEPGVILQLYGDAIELIPDKINILSIQTGDISADPEITGTMTMDTVYVTPRWDIG